jgi:hypothetical protein
MIGGGFGGFGGMGLGALGGLSGFAFTPEQIQERLKASGIAGYTPPAPAPVVTPRPTPVATPNPVPVMPVGGAYTSIGPNLRSAYTPTAPIAPPPVGTAAKRGDKRPPGTKRPVATTPPPTPVAPKPKPVIGSSAPPALKSRAPAPAPVTPPNRVGQPVSVGEFIPETTAVAPKPTPLPPAPVRNVMSAVPGQITVPAFDFSKLPTIPPVTQPKRSPALQARLDEIAAEIERKRQLEASKPTYSARLEDATPNMSKFRKALRTGYTGDNVDRVDDFYNTTFLDTMHDPESGNMYLPDAADFAEKEAYGTPITKEERMLNISSRAYFNQGDLPGYERTRFYEPPPEKYYTDARKAEVGAVTETIGDATSTDGVLNAVSNYYGSDVNRAEETRSFKGDIEGYTSTSPELMAEFQSVIRPLMEEKVAYGMSVGKMDYHETLMDAYNNDPVIRAVYDKYGVRPTRTSARGSEYIYDPLGYRDSRVVKRSPALGNAIKMAASLAFTAGIGGALGSTAAFGGGSSALGTAAAKGLTSAGITAITGGDGSDILKAGLLGGVGAYGQELAKAAEAAGIAAKGAEAGSELAKAAEATAKTADTFNKVVKTAKFVDAAVDGDLAGAVVASFGDKYTAAALDKVGLDKDFLADFNINQNDLTAGLVKTQLELAKGEDFGDALMRGLGEYIKEGGALGPNNVKTPEFIKRIGDAIKEVGSGFDDAILQPIKGFGEGFIEAVGDVAEPVVDVVEDIAGAVVDVAEPIIDAVEETGKAVEDVIKPIVDPIIDAAPVVEDVIKDAGRTVDDVIIQPVKDLVEEVVESLPDVDVDLPDVDIDLPDVDIDLPDVDIDLPNVDVGLPEAELPEAATPPFVPTLMPRFRQVISEVPEGQEITPYDFGDDALLAFLAGNLKKNQEGMAGGGAVRSSYGNLFDSIHSRNPAPTSNLDELLRIVGGR